MNQQATNGDTAETREILAHHLECFGKLDLAGTMTDYADESRFFSHVGVLHGSDSIRKFYGTLLRNSRSQGCLSICSSRRWTMTPPTSCGKPRQQTISSKSAPTPSS
jgi:hypothetical protein